MFNWIKIHGGLLLIIFGFTLPFVAGNASGGIYTSWAIFTAGVIGSFSLVIIGIILLFWGILSK